MQTIIFNYARWNSLISNSLKNYRNKLTADQYNKYTVLSNNLLLSQPGNLNERTRILKPTNFINHCRHFSEERESVKVNLNVPLEKTKHREYIFENIKEREKEAVQRNHERIFTETQISKKNENVHNRKEENNENEEEDEKLNILLSKRIEKKKKKNIIQITEEAKEEIKKRITSFHQEDEKNKDHILKLFFVTKGCNGLTHSLKFVHKNAIAKDDEIIYDHEEEANSKNPKNILLVVDRKCVLFVINTILDYFKDDLSEKFIFTNPNITSICPCGSSFHFSKES